MEEHCPCAGATLDRFLQPAVLAVLSEQSLHGYKLVRLLAGMPMFRQQSPNATGLYRCLKDMERRGLITSTKAASKKGPVVRLYHVTPLGCACLLRWTNTLGTHRRALGALLGRARRATQKNQKAGLLSSPLASCAEEGRGNAGRAHPEAQSPQRTTLYSHSALCASATLREEEAKHPGAAGSAGGASKPGIGRPAVADAPEGALIFQMGLYKAAVPKRLRYSRLHFWFDFPEGGGTRCGLTAYAVRLISDIFRIAWRVKAGDEVVEGQALGEMESVKAITEIYAPLNARVLGVNASVAADPSQVSLDPYGAWLLEFSGKPDTPLQAAEYVQFLTDEWEKTSKLFKG